MFNKKPKQPLTEEEQKIKDWSDKNSKGARVFFYLGIFFSFVGIALYLHGTITAGDYVVFMIPMWSLTIIILLMAVSRLNGYRIKTYIESIKPKDQ